MLAQRSATAKLFDLCARIDGCVTWATSVLGQLVPREFIFDIAGLILAEQPHQDDLLQEVMS